MTVLYTPMPIELVLEGIDRVGSKHQEMEFQGVKLQVEQYDVDKCRIVRLISTNPMDYLKNEFQPGTEIRFVPQFTDN
ncbi:YlzJ-like family protein [Phosphitispora sp. TUW77]|uniref:YlzJ-like family protein n=1 Tax=Phosphitispora sp. TUW77 TaxID=3152361 RepID=UPI003AB30C34